jgi:hypothetical protein
MCGVPSVAIFHLRRHGNGSRAAARDFRVGARALVEEASSSNFMQVGDPIKIGDLGSRLQVRSEKCPAKLRLLAHLRRAFTFRCKISPERIS